jgi:hypothetical protein
MTLLALAFALAAGATAGTDVDSLEHLWTGVRDSSEQVVVSNDIGINSWPESSERRVRAVGEPVELPWLGTHVLYFEEFLHDDPDNPRRQVLVRLEPAEAPAHAVRARLYTFNRPRAWVHAYLRPSMLTALTSEDVAAMPACDLLFTREGDQFRGGVLGRRCMDNGGHYLEYQLLIGQDLYWYRRRLLRKSDGEVQEEVIGFNWFELNATQLYTCRVDWTGTGKPQDLHPLTRLDVRDQGGHGRFVTPDGRKLEIILHSDDWPFAVERDALILVLQDQGAEIPFATAWSSIDTEEITLNLNWLRIRCGPTAPDLDELQASVWLSLLNQHVNILQQHRVEPLRHLHHQEMTGVVHDLGLKARQ